MFQKIYNAEEGIVINNLHYAKDNLLYISYKQLNYIQYNWHYTYLSIVYIRMLKNLRNNLLDMYLNTNEWFISRIL